MRTRNARVRRKIQAEKGDLLSQKWMTHLLALILIFLIIAFVVLSIPSVKMYIVDFIRVLRHGKEQELERPRINPNRLQNPFAIPFFLLKGDDIDAYQTNTL